MNTAGFCKARLGRMHDVTAGYIERGELPGIVTLIRRRDETHMEAIGAKLLAVMARCAGTQYSAAPP